MKERFLVATQGSGHSNIGNLATRFQRQNMIRSLEVTVFDTKTNKELRRCIPEGRYSKAEMIRMKNKLVDEMKQIFIAEG